MHAEKVGKHFSLYVEPLVTRFCALHALHALVGGPVWTPREAYGAVSRAVEAKASWRAN